MIKVFSVARSAWALTFCLGILTGCSGSGELGREQSGDFTFILSSKPSPLQVGQGADLTLELLNAQVQPQKGCEVTLMSTMPDMEMDDDKMQHHLSEHGAGVYELRLTEFHMGGDWRFMVQATCQGKHQTVTFDQTIPWPK